MNSEKDPRAYVMKLMDDHEHVLRIGHHSGTDARREQEVNRDSEDQWRIEFSVGLPKKLDVAAVEALTQAALQKHAWWRPRRAKGQKKQLVFGCSLEQAIAALKTAKEVVVEYLKMTEESVRGRKNGR